MRVVLMVQLGWSRLLRASLAQLGVLAHIDRVLARSDTLIPLRLEVYTTLQQIHRLWVLKAAKGYANRRKKSSSPSHDATNTPNLPPVHASVWGCDQEFRTRNA